ncbi:MAG: cytochrome c oxidase assembly protein [Chloroflexota bacterium]
MDESVVRLLLSYELQPFFVFVILTFGTLYTVGWFRLRRRSKSKAFVPIWKLVAYLFALFTLAAALMSFIDILGASLFYFHMIQHLMITMIAGPLIMLVDPVPIILWGFPDSWGIRKAVIRGFSKILHRNSPYRNILRKVTSPLVSYVLMLVLLWGWHDPNLYNLALRSEFWHDFEHISFFYSSIIYWWHATGSGPRIQPRMPRSRRILFLFGGIPSTFLPGVVISFSTTVIYTYYLTAPPAIEPFYMAPINDQIIGGIIMWVPGSMMFFVGALILIGRWLQEQERTSRRKKEKWMRENSQKPSLPDAV